MFSCSIGDIHFSELPFVLRDFTYINYQREAQREAPSDDPFPGVGIHAAEIMLSLMNVNKSNDKYHSEPSMKLLRSLFSLSNDIQNSRMRLIDTVDKHKLSSKTEQKIPKITLKAALSSWIRSFETAYKH